MTVQTLQTSQFSWPTIATWLHQGVLAQQYPAAATAIAAVPLDTLTKPAAVWQPHAGSQPQTWQVTLSVQHPAVHSAVLSQLN